MSVPQYAGLSSKQRYPIIDALRFILALWVTIGHLGHFPLFVGIDTNTQLGHILTHAWDSTIWGVPAVVCFFVISGFCIHLPYRHGEALLLRSFYVRRYIRILLPVCVGVVIYRSSWFSAPIWGSGSILWRSVLWSLLCEEIYYAIYPLARRIRLRYGWKVLLVGAFATGIVGAIIFPNAMGGSLIENIEIAVILYPIWLLGCVLVEESDHSPALDSGLVIWKWRFLAWFGSWVAEMLHFKGKLTLGRTLLCFGILAFFWIRKELAHGKRRNPSRALAWAGLWSYSLYLLHIPSATIFHKFRMPNLGGLPNWFVYYSFVFVFSYAFYLCIEKPSHQLARRLSSHRSESSPSAAIQYSPVVSDS